METSVQTCYRHPDRQAGIVCQRCDRPICPSCMHQASVGFHCPECTKAGAQRVYTGFDSLRSKPIVTQVLIGINLAVFLLGLVFGGAAFASGHVTDYQIHLALIAKSVASYGGGFHLIGVGEGQWYRIVTGAFLHYGFLHIAFNMYALWVLGNALEPAVGRLRFGLIYFASLTAGAFGALIATPDALTAGASGAIFGLLGALFLAHRAVGIPLRNSPLLFVLILNLVLTFTLPGLSAGGHIGGLIGGAIAGWVVFDLGRRPGVKAQAVTAILWGLTFGFAILAIWYASAYQLGT